MLQTPLLLFYAVLFVKNFGKGNLKLYYIIKTLLYYPMQSLSLFLLVFYVGLTK